MKKTVLLVEDDPGQVELTRCAFKRNSISAEIIAVEDGVEALDYLFGTGCYAGRDTCIQPNLVLLDLNLPKINGLDVLRRLRDDTRTKALSVVMLTSSEDERGQACALGANGYFQKPIGFNEFVRLVREIETKWL